MLSIDSNVLIKFLTISEKYSFMLLVWFCDIALSDIIYVARRTVARLTHKTCLFTTPWPRSRSITRQIHSSSFKSNFCLLLGSKMCHLWFAGNPGAFLLQRDLLYSKNQSQLPSTKNLLNTYKTFSIKSLKQLFLEAYVWFKPKVSSKWKVSSKSEKWNIQILFRSNVQLFHLSWIFPSDLFFRLIHAFSSPWPSFGSLTFALCGAAAPGYLGLKHVTLHVHTANWYKYKYKNTNTVIQIQVQASKCSTANYM